MIRGALVTAGLGALAILLSLAIGARGRARTTENLTTAFVICAWLSGLAGSITAVAFLTAP